MPRANNRQATSATPQVEDFLRGSYNHMLNQTINLTHYVQRSIINNGGDLTIDSRRAIINWLTENSERRDNELFAGTLKRINLQYMSSQTELHEIYLSFDYFTTYWTYRLDKRFVQRVQHMDEHSLHYLLTYMNHILDGYFDSGQYGIKVTELASHDLQPYQIYLQAELPVRKAIIFVISLEKIPKLNSQGLIIGFDYQHCVRFLDWVPNHDINQIKKTVTNYQNSLLKDPAKSDFGFLTSYGASNSGQYNKKNIVKPLFIQETVSKHAGQIASDTLETYCQFGGNMKSVAQAQKLGNIRWAPSTFSSKFLSKSEIQGLVFNKQIARWVARDYASALERHQFQQYQTQMNKELLNKYADFSSAAKLVELLQKIPNFKIRLTEEEQDVVGSTGNLLVIGRSGTGKTTCAILRMFAMELLFKLRVSLYKQKHQAVLQDTRYSADDIDSQIGLHFIFATASPVLTNEVQRYYTSLTEQVKAELEKKQQKLRAEEERKKAERKQQSQDFQIVQSEEQDQGEVGFDDDNEEESPQKHEEDFIKDQMEDIQIEAQPEDFDEDDDLDEEENNLKQKMDKFVSLADIKDNEFPAFLTIRKLILMIDGAMVRPFFSRNVSKQVVGTDSKANWHNENSGVVMIENFRKKFKGDDEEINEDISDNDDDNDDEVEEQIDLENEQDIELEFKRQEALQNIKKLQNSKKKDQPSKLLNNVLAKEVEYDLFYNQFWVRQNIQLFHKDLSVLNATVVWTEIFSNIKGSANSHEFGGHHLPQRVYVQQDGRMLSQTQKEKVYEIFIQYESWKLKNKYYDMMDIVNYLLTQFKYGRYTGAPVHYLMIDEVQDLSHATLLLLSKITEQGLFFAGDTAQNIAKGVGFRFCDLKSLFQQRHFGLKMISPPEQKQLTVNFRSHNQILEVANSLVTLVELFFPKTIDRLKKERSNIKGPKPMIIQGTDVDMLFFVLSGQEKYKSDMHSSNQEGLAKRPPLEFGCNQVILVKDQESKKKIPNILQHALCLTIYEAKGLEFDDVVLFNFFNDSPIPDTQWNLLNQTQIQEEWIDSNIFYKNVTKHRIDLRKPKKQAKTFDDTSSGSDSGSELESDEEEKQEQEDKNVMKEEDDALANIFGLMEEAGKVLTQKICVRQNIHNDFNPIEYSQLCVELKLLYVAVTRPRNRLIIFDESLGKRDKVQQMWEKLGLVSLITGDDIQQALNESTGDASLQFKEVATKTQLSEWKKQGLKMFRNKFYEQAVKCFQSACDKVLEDRARAYFTAELASKMQSELEADKTNLKVSQVKGARKQQMLREIKLKEQSIRAKYKNAAVLFEADGKYKQQAQCLYSAEQYADALKVYERLELWKEAGESAFLCNKYDIAADYFDKAGDYIRAIDACEKLRQWEKILQLVHKYKDTMNFSTREAYLKLYLPIALDDLLQEVDFNSSQQTGANALTNQNQNKDGVEIIDEDDDEDIEELDNDEEEDDYEEEDEVDSKVDPQQFKTQEEKQELEVQQEAVLISLEQSQLQQSQFEGVSLQESAAEVVEQEKSNLTYDKVNQISFSDASVLEKQQSEIQEVSKAIISFDTQQQISFSECEHLSHVDLDDEFLKHDRKSLMESIQSGKESEVSHLSDFSALSMGVANNPKLQIVKTKGDIYIQDSVMNKIIRLISMFSEDFKASLLRQKSKAVQLSQQKPQNDDFDYLVDFILDLDLVDLEFIYLVLDTLEQFHSYKLCIFVCNRYKLSTKVGRYLACIGSRYSPIALEPVMLKQVYAQNTQQRVHKWEQGRVAHFALHQVLENINPDYLGMRFPDETEPKQNLGERCFQQLIQLGYWKKCLYSLDYHNALKLADSFSDYGNWKHIYLSNQYRLAKKVNDLGRMNLINQEIERCFEINLKRSQLLDDDEYALMWFEDFASNLISCDKKFIDELKEINLHPKLHPLENYLAYSKSLQNSIQDLLMGWKFSKNEFSSSEGFLFIQQLELTILSLQNHQLKNVLDNNKFLDLVLRLQRVLSIINTGHDINAKFVLRALYNTVKAKVPQGNLMQALMKDNLIVHRSSPIIQDLIEIRQSREIAKKRADEQELERLMQEERAKNQTSQVSEKVLKDNIIKKMNSKGQQDYEDMFFIDIDLNHVMVPQLYVNQIISHRLVQQISKLVRNRYEAVWDQEIGPFLSDMNYNSMRLEKSAFCLALMDLKIRIHADNLKKTKSKLSKEEQELMKYQKDDPLRYFVQMEQRKKKEEQAQKYRMQLIDEELLDDDDLDNVWRTTHQPQEGFLNRLKTWGSTDIDYRKKAIYAINVQLIMLQSKNQNLHPVIRTSLMDLALSYLRKTGTNSKGLFVQKYFVRAVFILNYVGGIYHALSKLRNLQKGHIENDTVIGYRKLIEYFETKNLGIIADSNALIGEYFEISSRLMRADERFQIIANMVTHALIAVVGKRRKEFKLMLPELLLSCVPDLKYSRIQNSYDGIIQPVKTSFCFVDDDKALVDATYWIGHCLQNIGMMSKVVSKMLLLVLTILANLETFSKELATYLVGICNQICYYEKLDSVLNKYPDWKALTRVGDTPTLVKLRDTVLNKSGNQLKFQIDPRQTLHIIQIQNNVGNNDAIYDESFYNWSMTESKNFHFIRAQKKIAKAINIPTLSKINKIWKNRSITQDFTNAQPQYIIKLSQHQQLFDLYHTIDKFRASINQTYYQTYLSSALDFQYINMIINKHYEAQLAYKDQIVDFLSGHVEQSDIYKRFVKLKQEYDEQIAAFESWKRTNVKFDDGTKMLERNRKIIALKWLNRKSGIAEKFQKLQKKRTGAKKQEYQAEKKQRLKGR